MQKSPDCLRAAIIGGGVAGMSCALWLKHLGFTPVIIEQGNQLGGLLLQLNRVNRWVLGTPGKTSIELAGLYAAHIEQEAITVLYQTQILAVTALMDGFELQVTGTDNKPYSMSVRAIVIATGVRVLGAEALSGIKGIDALNNAGLLSYFPFDHLDQLPALKGKIVAVLGGGDNAHYTAKDIASAGGHVHLLVRSKPKARPVIRQEVEELIKQGLISKHYGTQVQALRHDKDKIVITISNDNGVEDKIYVDKVFVRIGFAPNSDFLEAYEALAGLAKESGYIKTDSTKRTAIPWVYAIGDVANGKHQSVASAIADGAIAAQDLSDRM